MPDCLKMFHVGRCSNPNYIYIVEGIACDSPSQRHCFANLTFKSPSSVVHRRRWCHVLFVQLRKALAIGVETSCQLEQCTKCSIYSTIHPLAISDVVMASILKYHCTLFVNSLTYVTARTQNFCLTYGASISPFMLQKIADENLQLRGFIFYCIGRVFLCRFSTLKWCPKVYRSFGDIKYVLLVLSYKYASYMYVRTHTYCW